MPATAVLAGEPPLERVFALNSAARELGLACGMSRLQVESFAAVLLRRDLQREQLAFAALIRCAERFSPRIQVLTAPQEEGCGATLLLDVSGSRRLLGSPSQIAREVHRAVCETVYDLRHACVPHICQPQADLGHTRCAICGTISVAVAQNGCTAILAARGLPGSTVIVPRREAATLAPLPLSVLGANDEQSETLAVWGIRTLGQLAALEPPALAARLGQSGLHLQRQARGDHDHLLVPEEPPPDAPLHGEVELQHAVELLEPLLFLLNQLLEQVIARAGERALAIASLEITLLLEKACESALNATRSAEDRRSIRPALPERDRLGLLKLIQLELEMHPPAAAVKALRIVAQPAPPQSAQQGLFAAQAPEPGRLEILLARLRKLAGEGRVGAPELLDSRAPEAFRITRFAPEENTSVRGAPPSPLSLQQRWGDLAHSPALRMLRPPHAVAVEVCDGAPAIVREQGQSHTVQASSGPWRTTGAWWSQPHPGHPSSAFEREEWEVVVQEDVSLDDTAPHLPVCKNRPARMAQQDKIGCCLRLAHDVASSAWYVIGVYD